jgi:dienelactone hydrolase
MKAIWNNMRCVDLLQQLPQVDGQRIGCIGHSLGGHNTIFTSFFDERISVAVTSCGFTRFHKYYRGNLKGWTSDRYMPRIAQDYQNDPDRVPFDFPELIAGLAPRAFFTSSPVRDDNFDVEGVRETISEATRIYRLYGAQERLRAIYPDSAHDFPVAARREAYQFIDSILRRASSSISSP